jgi:hypothetical protein
MSDYVATGTMIGKIVQEKNEAYGNSVAEADKILHILFPDGIPSDKYCDVALIVRILDKLMRIATQKEAFGESPYLDIAGYGLLGYEKDRNS